MLTSSDDELRKIKIAQPNSLSPAEILANCFSLRHVQPTSDNFYTKSIENDRIYLTNILKQSCQIRALLNESGVRVDFSYIS